MLIFSFRLLDEVARAYKRGPVMVFLVIERENIERMRAADPYDIRFHDYRALFDCESRLRDVDLVIAYEEDLPKIHDFHARGDMAGLVSWLERGRTIQRGDCEPPIPMEWLR